MLPGMDGFAVPKKLRGARNQTPTLMLAAHDAAQDVIEALNPDANDNLTKPFSLIVLLAPLHAVSRPGSPPQAAPRENLVEAIWGFHSEVHNNILEAFVRLLRDKVDPAGESKLIQTVRGVGCCLPEERV